MVLNRGRHLRPSQVTRKQVSIFIFLAIAIIGALVRIGLRVVYMRTFGWDDSFLLLALVSLAATCAINQQLGTILYIQIFASLDLIQFPANLSTLLLDHQLLQGASFLGWVSIFAAKLSLIVFFRKLVYRVQPLEKLWMIVLVTVSIFACITIPLGFMVCTDFSADFISKCFRFWLLTSSGGMSI